MTEKTEDLVLMLVNVRLAFPELWTPSQVQGKGKPAFSATFLLPPEHPDIAKVKAAIAACAKAKWGDQAAEILPLLLAGDKVCLHNGDMKANLEGYKGNMFVSARTPTRPLVIGQDRSPLTESDGKPYSGCFVNAQIALWAQQNTHGKRVNAQLRGVQFFRDGEAFSGGGVAQPDEFEEVVADADGDAPVATTGGVDDYSEFL